MIKLDQDRIPVDVISEDYMDSAVRAGILTITKHEKAPYLNYYVLKRIYIAESSRSSLLRIQSEMSLDLLSIWNRITSIKIVSPPLLQHSPCPT